ncbi:MAG TPA: NAD(P)/FAD-dependent oxidoreductase [Terriglobales bacterium]|nr:NAD(P)/FAD-dependent oxidoreductase [Terriglobales bacterium]
MGSLDAKTAPHVVIVGGGFGGLSAALALKSAPVRITLIDRRNFHLFQPLLYQVATGWLSPANIASNLRAVLRYQKNANVLLAEVTGIDTAAQRVLFADGFCDYDMLVVASGSQFHYFGNEGWRSLAPGLKSVEDATEIRKRIFSAFENAERKTDTAKRAALLTFAIVGGGPTGVELAGALGEIAHDILAHDFRTIGPTEAKIILIEAGGRVLPTYSAELSQKAVDGLKKLGVNVRAGAMVSDVGHDSLVIKHNGAEERLACHTVIWAAGVEASALGRMLAAETGAKVDRQGRVEVEADLSLAGDKNIFVIGDLANASHQTGKPLAGVAPVAIQEGRYVARAIAARIEHKPIAPFHYRNRGSMAIIGRASAVAQIGRWEFSGHLAWLAWLFIHVMELVEFENRVLVLVQWGWYYFSRNRAARLITGQPLTGAAEQNRLDPVEPMHGRRKAV